MGKRALKRATCRTILTEWLAGCGKLAPCTQLCHCEREELKRWGERVGKHNINNAPDVPTAMFMMKAFQEVLDEIDRTPYRYTGKAMGLADKVIEKLKEQP